LDIQERTGGREGGREKDGDIFACPPFGHQYRVPVHNVMKV